MAVVAVACRASWGRKERMRSDAMLSLARSTLDLLFEALIRKCHAHS